MTYIEILKRVSMMAFIASASVRALAETIEVGACTVEPAASGATFADRVFNRPAWGGVEIRNWESGAVTAAGEAVWTLRFKKPVDGATVLALGSPDIAFSRGGEFQPAPRPVGGRNRPLRVCALPSDARADALRFAMKMQILNWNTAAGEASSGTAAYGATLPYAVLLPFSAVNVSEDAAVAVSSSGDRVMGFTPQGWVNDPRTLNDGFVDGQRNFSTVKRAGGIKPNQPEWITLSWPEPRRLKAVVVLYGEQDLNAGGVGENCRVEVWTGKEDQLTELLDTIEGSEEGFASFDAMPEPPSAVDSQADPRTVGGRDAGWEAVKGRWSKPERTPGGGVTSCVFVFPETISTAGLRLRVKKGATVMAAGEIIALADPSDSPPSAQPSGVPISFSTSERGKVSIQIRNERGEVVANPVTGEPFEAGDHLVHWDLTGIEDNEPLSAPGRYTWRGVFVPELSLDYQHFFYPTPLKSGGVPWLTPDGTGGWLADHFAPKSIARVGSNLWITAFAEAGHGLIRVAPNGDKIWGATRIGLANPSVSCADGNDYWGYAQGGWLGGRHAVVQVLGSNNQARVVKEWSPPPFGGCSGFQVVDGIAYVAHAERNEIKVWDFRPGQETSAEIDTIPVPAPGQIRKWPQGGLVLVSGRSVVLLDPKTHDIRTLVKDGLENPGGLGVAPDGSFYVGEMAPLHQVRCFSPDGRPNGMIGKPGVRKPGAFDVDDLEAPFGVEVGPDGRLWVCEMDFWPRRVSIWDVETRRCVHAVYGPTSYGGGGTVDPADGDRAFYRGLEMRRDPKTGAFQPVNLFLRPGTSSSKPFGGTPSYAFRTGRAGADGDSELWFTSEMEPMGNSGIVLWHYEVDHVRPVAAAGSSRMLFDAFGVKPANEDGNSTAGLETVLPGIGPEDRYFAWTDLNDDGGISADEVRLARLEDADGRTLGAPNAGWLSRMNRKFEVAFGAGEGLVAKFSPVGFTPAGYPILAPPANPIPAPYIRSHHQGRSASSHLVDGAGNLLLLGRPLMSVAPDGRVRWRYRNDWPSLHDSQRTTARGDEPGVLIGTTRFWGLEKVNEDVGEVVCFNSNLGCIYLMTADDGIFIDRVFQDKRCGFAWNMSCIPPPEVLAKTSLSDEHFRGSFQKVRQPDGTDAFTVICGKIHSSVVKLGRLEAIRRLPGGTFEVTDEQFSRARAAAESKHFQKSEIKTYTVWRSNERMGITGDGRISDAKWRHTGAPVRNWAVDGYDSFQILCDDENLHFRYDGRDEQALFVNSGEDFQELFTTGDAVDLMLQTRPGLSHGRREPQAGDIRLCFAPYRSKPVCVLFDYRNPAVKGPPVQFASPVGKTLVDRVAILDKVAVTVVRDERAKTFSLRAAIPLSAIGLDIRAMDGIRGDVSRVYSDQTGGSTVNRVNWSSPNIVLTSDLASEAMVQPCFWGEFRFARQQVK